MSSNDKKYSVGYGKPPRGKPFAKGQSGNPTGRPSKSAPDPLPTSMRNIVLDALKRKVSVRDNGEPRQVEAKQAVVLAQIATALKGNAIAQRDLLQLAARCEAEAKEEHWDTYHFWAVYKHTHAAEIAKGIPFDDLPHPDDVVIHDDGSVTFDGPIGQDQKLAIEALLRIREAFLFKILWDERHLKEVPDDRAASMSPWWIFLVITKKYLPPRFRWTDDELLFKIVFYSFRPKKRLLKNLHEAIDAAPETVCLKSAPIRSLRQIMTRAGCTTIEEFGAYMWNKAKREVGQT